MAVPSETQAVQVNRTVQWVARFVTLGILIWIAWAYPPLHYWPMWLSAAGWIGFSVYWARQARNSAAAQSAESSKSRRLHELLTNLAIFLLFIPVPGLMRGFLTASAVWIVAGLLVQACAIALAAWARAHLGSNWSGRIEIKQDHQLIRTGPYRVLRHPIYTAVLGMCLGTALVDGHLHSLAAIAIMLAAYWRKVRMEETKLREMFGSVYNDYRRHTLGAVPGFF